MNKYICVPIILFVVIPLSAQTHKRFNYGFYTGWAFGISDEFKEDRARPQQTSHNKLGLHLGTYFQYNFNPNYSLQLNMNLQPLKLERSYDKDKSIYITSLTLNAVVTSNEYHNMNLYFSAGAGINIGHWAEWPDIYDHLTFETGLKLNPAKSDSNSVIKLGLSIHHLRDTLAIILRKRYDDSATYIRLDLGIEF